VQRLTEKQITHRQGLGGVATERDHRYVQYSHRGGVTAGTRTSGPTKTWFSAPAGARNQRHAPGLYGNIPRGQPAVAGRTTGRGGGLHKKPLANPSTTRPEGRPPRRAPKTGQHRQEQRRGHMLWKSKLGGAALRAAVGTAYGGEEIGTKGLAGKRLPRRKKKGAAKQVGRRGKKRRTKTKASIVAGRRPKIARDQPLRAQACVRGQHGSSRSRRTAGRAANSGRDAFKGQGGNGPTARSYGNEGWVVVLKFFKGFSAFLAPGAPREQENRTRKAPGTTKRRNKWREYDEGQARQGDPTRRGVRKSRPQTSAF